MDLTPLGTNVARVVSAAVASPTTASTHWVTLTCALAIFAAAYGVRAITSIDQQYHMAFAHRFLYAQPKHYQLAADRIRRDGLGAFVDDGYNDRGGARLLVHPPGYPILVAVVRSVAGESDEAQRTAQLLADSLSVGLLFLLTNRLFNLRIAVTAGALAALSPQLAYNALVLQPDSCAVVPLLAAMLALALARSRGRVTLALVAGALLGSSCWIRANAAFLPLFLAVVVVPVVFDAGRRGRAAVGLVLAAAAVIAPIALRNWIVFGRVVPLSLGAGITMMEGIADYDREGRFGFPANDLDVARREAEWTGRPEYAKAIWAPDGIDRDRARLARAGRVVATHPLWFGWVMARRSAVMVRYNDGRNLGWPADTSKAPAVDREPTFHHTLEESDSASQREGRAIGELLLGDPSYPADPSDGLRDEVVAPGRPLESPALDVVPGTDYILRCPIQVLSGSGSVQVVDERGLTLALTPLVRTPRLRPASTAKVRAKRASFGSISMPFASRTAVRVHLVATSDTGGTAVLAMRLGSAVVRELGPTPLVWTRPLRVVIHTAQADLYRTLTMRLLIGAGTVILSLARRRRELQFCLAIPIYYCVFQSPLHTEYRYVLAMHFFLFAIAAVALVTAGTILVRVVHASARGSFAAVRRKRTSGVSADGVTQSPP